MAIIDSTITIGDQEVKVLVEGDDSHKSVRSSFGRSTAEISKRETDRHEDVFGKGLDLATNCAKRIVAKLQEMDPVVRPDGFQVQLGIRLDSEVGAVIAKAKSAAQLNVSMSWKKPTPKAVKVASEKQVT